MAWSPPALTEQQILEIPRSFVQMFGFLHSRPGPTDEWREFEDREAVMGNTLNPEALWEAGVDPRFIAAWLGGIRIPGLRPDHIKFDVPDYPRF